MKNLRKRPSVVFTNDLTKENSTILISRWDSDKEHQGIISPLLERSALYPRLSLSGLRKVFLLLWGFWIWIDRFFSSIAALREYFDRSALRAPALAQQLGVSLLGELPVIRWKGPSAAIADRLASNKNCQGRKLKRAHQ